MDRIPVAGPWITQKEIDYVSEAAADAWYENANVFNDRFEKAFAAYVGRTHAISLPSCTSALHLSLAALGLGPGDEVIVPDINWIASSAPVSYVGATPVFADVDRDSWCLDAETVEACRTPATRAVIVVDLYGNMPEMDSLQALCSRHRLALIEDAAEAVGAEYKGRRAGSFGDVGVYSFHGSKTLTTGEGGMLLTDREELYRRCLVLRDHGRQPGDRFFHNDEVAFKYKMSSLQAALGLAQLERIDEIMQRKREIFAWYREDLGRVAGLTLNRDLTDVASAYWMVTLLWEADCGPDKRAVMDALRERGVDSRPFFHPLSSLPAYRDTDEARKASDRNRVAYEISPRGVNLPSALNLTREQVSYVCRQVREVVCRGEKERS